MVHESGFVLPDFSYAGMGQGAEIPPIPTESVSLIELGGDPTGERPSDDALRAALSDPDVHAIFIPAGNWRFAQHHRATRPLVVFGEGPEHTYLHFQAARSGSDSAGIEFVGKEALGDRVYLREDAPMAQHELTLGEHRFEVGDSVAIGWRITPEFIREHDMPDTPFANQEKVFFRRTVIGTTADTIIVDVPLRWRVPARDEAFVALDGGYLEGAGLRDFAISTEVAEADAYAQDRHHAIRLHHVAESYVANIRSFGEQAHLQSGGILVSSSRGITIDGVELGPAQHRGSGGNGYLFEIMKSNEVLVRDCVGDGGRHNFIANWDFGTSGAVFLRTLSINGRAQDPGSSFSTTGPSEFHHSLAMANLIDSSESDDGWAAVNRKTFSSGAGHAATRTVFWNTSGTGEIRSFQWQLGAVVGTTPELSVVTELDAIDLFGGHDGTAPQDLVEGLGKAQTLVPSSLYEAQRALR